MIKEIEIKERRRIPRVVLQRAITYEPGVLQNKGKFLPTRRIRGFLVNMSNDGICFRTRHRLREKMVLKVSLPVSEISPAAPTLAQVIWVMRDPKRKEFHTGLRFII
ncbi:MAG: PilZ domain-containing protein [Nitrospiria bacterium]